MNYTDYMADPSRPCAVAAHRGVWHAAPENSLPAIEGAISAGYEVVEIDVQRSADGEYFLLHDATLERMTGLHKDPTELTMRQLSGMKLRNRDGRDAKQITQERVPNLKEVFSLTRDRIFIHLDIKDREMIPDVISCARSMGVDQQVDFWADVRTHEDYAWVCDVVKPHNVPFMARIHLEETDAAAQLELMFALEPFLCEVSFARIAQISQLRERCQQAGIALWVNTLDSVASAGFTDTAALSDPAAVWGSLIDAGVSVIQTDEAEALQSFVQRHRA
ncbi:glycerophosphodiester phosphodiesterase family protein [Streptomyces chartreusis]|uniref:glycerophosphodiester phosphodiesterase family protein n=1 Tax=Streptomyces chartreusis TaxID=1969 RepID=UPI00366302A8